MIQGLNFPAAPLTLQPGSSWLARPRHQRTLGRAGRRAADTIADCARILLALS
jgi:hypothetical protein